MSIASSQDRLERIQGTNGLITLIRFQGNGPWTTEGGCTPGLPIHLRRIGDPRRYSPNDWPYAGDLAFDTTGPFGRALCCRQGRVYAEIPRRHFDNSPLDIHGYRSGTIMAWAKFTGCRHLVAGIWDEGGWDRYAGRRQYAIFGGMFDSKAVTAHISSTGAASYPQSSHFMARYARERALDGRPFDNNEWHCFGMSWDAQEQWVKAWLDGVATPLLKTDNTAQDAFQYTHSLSANPMHWPWPVYGPWHFLMKFNGYTFAADGIAEHFIECDLEAAALRYRQLGPEGHMARPSYGVICSIERKGQNLYTARLSVNQDRVLLPRHLDLAYGDVVVAELLHEQTGRVGTLVRRTIEEGAPFTIGRALGLGEGTDLLEHGSEIAVDGVAVFDRALDPAMMLALAE